MASIRNIKKDIDFLVSEVISDCYTYMMLYNRKNEEKVVGIINDLIISRNKLIERVNNPDKDLDTKQLKQHFKGIYTDLFNFIDSSFSQLSELSKQ
ncbi:MAG: hypothetical protein WBI34_10840 [Tenuifilaceae bacterium]|jgi:hypothetical protein|nr:hypothetical protein [Bacteroidales bacterium]MDI9516731.1 hypothetical protein [Bacteroidota bacterium]NLH57680.1 hypothetical protein [Rikenellaceae bacterium]OQC61027.1 MAG: hypothetical protein BWX49_02475 [Bacteroidetes bacterium ADurb.Bin008]HNV82041.1 hypothetical protein [Tenuifilaceae bacterium]